QRVRPLHLLERPAHGFDLGGEGLLQADVRALRTDRVRRDGEPFKDLVGVGSEEEAVLEGGRLALGAVAHGEPGSGADGPDRAPLLAGWEARAPPAPEPASG